MYHHTPVMLAYIPPWIRHGHVHSKRQTRGLMTNFWSLMMFDVDNTNFHVNHWVRWTASETTTTDCFRVQTRNTGTQWILKLLKIQKHIEIPLLITPFAAMLNAACCQTSACQFMHHRLGCKWNQQASPICLVYPHYVASTPIDYCLN